MPAFTSILLGAGAALSAASSISKGNAAGRAGDFNAMMDEKNAKLSEEQGAADAAMARLNSRKQIGGAHASIGASGITADSGSAMDVLAESAATGEMDALRAKHAGDLKAWQYRMGAINERDQADSARSSGYLGAAGALVGGGAQIAASKKPARTG